MSDIYLEIPGYSDSPAVAGDVTDKKFKQHIQVASLTTGMTNPSTVSVGTQAGSAGGGGKVIMQDVTFTKLCDRASPLLWLRCAKGDHFRRFEFKYVISRGNSSDVFKTVTLSDVLVTSFAHSGSVGSELPQENLALNFAKIEIKYWPRDSAGGYGQPESAGYDLVQAKSL